MVIQVDDVSNAAPSSVTFDSLGARTRKLSKNLRGETIGIGLKAAFEAPTLFLPHDAAYHWPLSPVEHKKLTADVEAVVDMLPKKIQTKGIEAAAKIFPPLALLLSAYLITVPRIQLTKMALQRMKTNAQQPPPQPRPPHVEHSQADPAVVGDIGARRDATHSTNAPGGVDENDSNGNDRNTSPGDVSQYSAAFLDEAARF